ncbi:MAG: Gfo/Idh/MocA family oxidoreductase [Trueperaceae bacterium]|nr:Gfo/Idh/MocA family oxidoreductase [Trueperaceae bacterium]
MDPLRVALVGTGNRSQSIYKPLFKALEPWIDLVAVCDPVRESADAFAADTGALAFYNLKDLVKARPMEAALIVAPIPSHHSISCYLLSHSVHVNVETSMAVLLAQAEEMLKTARANNSILRVAENFFRFPFDRIMKEIAQTDFIGPVKRLTCWHDHTGYHNNSRWIRFFESHPVAVQSVEHTMPTAPHNQLAHRHYESETYSARFFWFPEGELVIDHAGNIKGMLGRYPRPGYTELAGTRGSIVQQAGENWYGLAEVRYCSDEALAKGAIADEIFPIIYESDGRDWLGSYVDLPGGRVRYHNPYRFGGSTIHRRDYYAAAVMGHLVDFAETVRGIRHSEYNDDDAVMAMMMEVAARESALAAGKRLTLPLTGALESEDLLRQAETKTYGVDPLDIEAMLAISYPRP